MAFFLGLAAVSRLRSRVTQEATTLGGVRWLQMQSASDLQNNLMKAREEKYKSRIRLLEALASGTSGQTHAISTATYGKTHVSADHVHQMKAHPAENDPQDPAQPNRFSAVIEKIERLYMGKHSSDEEDLDDVSDDDQYDTEDSFIDDAELVVCARYSDEEYFQVRCKGSKEIYNQHYGRYNIDKIWRDDILPCRVYLRHCDQLTIVKAAEHLESKGATSREDTSSLTSTESRALILGASPPLLTIPVPNEVPS